MPEPHALLQRAQKPAISGDYPHAFACLEKILSQTPDHIETLRFKGNILELKAFHDQLNKNINLGNCPEMMQARTCYEHALAHAPNHPGLLADLGTHWKNLGNADKAMDYLDRTLAQVLPQIPPPSHDSELNDIALEALEEKIEILHAQGKHKEAQYFVAKQVQLQTCLHNH